MPLKLEDIFASERSGRLEAQHEAVVDHRPGPVLEPCEGRHTGSRDTPEHALRNLDNQGPRHPHDCDAAPSGRGRDRRNRVAGTRKVHWPARPGMHP